MKASSPRIQGLVKDFEKCNTLKAVNISKNGNNNNNDKPNRINGYVTNVTKQPSANNVRTPFSYGVAASSLTKPGTCGAIVATKLERANSTFPVAKPHQERGPPPPIPPKPRCDSGYLGSSSILTPFKEANLHKAESTAERRKSCRVKIRRHNSWPKLKNDPVVGRNTPPLSSSTRTPRRKTLIRGNTIVPSSQKSSRPSTLDFETLSAGRRSLIRTVSFTLAVDRDSLFSEQSSQFSDSECEDEDNVQNEGESSKQLMIAKEFLTTESRYVKTLEALCVDFPKFLEKEAHNLRRPLSPSDVPQQMSKALEPLLRLHQKMLEDFEKCIENWNSDSPGLAKILLQYGHFLRMSCQFLRQKSYFALQIMDLCKKFPDFSAAVQAFERQSFNGLLLVHQLDCVHQRICRYPLLLTTYVKNTPVESDEHVTATEAKKLLESIAKDIEDGLISGDDTRNLLEIQRRVQSRYEIIQPGRKLLKEGEILKHSRKELQSRVLLLFNDVLLYCAPVVSSSTGNLWIRNEFDLSTTRLTIPSQDDGDCVFNIHGKKRSIIVKAKNSDERISWVSAIEGAIKEIKERRRFAVVDELTPTDTSPTTQLGKVAPIWIPDDRVTMCQNCKSNFTGFRRRHHCRGCGKVICSDCCGTAPLEYEGYEAKIVCPTCYKLLFEQVSDSDYVAYNGFISPGPEAVLINLAGKRTSRQSLLPKFKAPKNSAFDNNLSKGVLVDGFLNVLEKRNWIRYWVILCPLGVLEFYSAPGDPVSKKSYVLLSFDVHEVSVVNGSEQVVFNLVHSNQFATKDASANEVRLTFKAENMVAAERWLDGLRRVKEGNSVTI